MRRKEGWYHGREMGDGAAITYSWVIRERRAQEAVTGQLHPMEFLRLLLEDEHLSRKDRTATHLPL